MVLDPGALIPTHRHPEDVVTLILEGRMEMTVGCETRTIGPGEIFLVPSDSDHSGHVLDDQVVAVSFSRT
jgi:quercetin dioxygenase-like cupin family protein